jgi:glutaredoxin
MPRLNRQNIDRKTNKPNPTRTESFTPDLELNRAMQTRRDDDVIKTKQRTIYDIDFAIKWYIDNEIQPQITSNKQLITIPVIFSNGEKWDNVRRLGYLRDEKGMLQSPLIMLKRNSVSERDAQKTLDVNRPNSANYIVHRSKYNARNRYEDELFPIPTNNPQPSEQFYIVDIPKYVTVEYDMMLWCDFTTQMNELIDQILPYGRFSWGNDANKFPTTIGSISFETINTIGEDRLVRATIPLSVLGTLLSEQEVRLSTIKKMYSIKKVTFDQVVDVDNNIFETLEVPTQLLQLQTSIMSGGTAIISGPGINVSINAQAMTYLTNLTEIVATYSNATTVTITSFAAINPVTYAVASKNEFDIFINGQYIDKAVYTWTPSDIASQSIVFDTNILGYTLTAQDVVVVKGRWA